MSLHPLQILLLEKIPPRLRHLLLPVFEAAGDRVQEIRICQDKPILVQTAAGELYVSPAGPTDRLEEAVIADAGTVKELLDAVTSSSVYALQDAMKEGYIPLPGGHRAGLCGEARTEGGRVAGFRHVSGLNIRLKRDLSGVASPPGAGKTTLLRDLIRTLSRGAPEYGLKPQRVGVADERGELAGAFRGVAQNDLGPRADVIDRCPKRFALAMLVRTMSPDVVVTDEIGHPEDAEAALDAVTAGVALVCSAHGATLADVKRRPSLRPLLEHEVFQRVVVLSKREGPG